MSRLPAPLRRQLENAIKEARSIAEGGARKALQALAVHEPDPYRHLDEEQRKLRRKLRAQARQLGDGESQTKRGSYEIKRLVEKLAYDQWHRLLFARFLLENNLLISPDHGVSVSLDDCEELAPSLGLKDAWAVAARFAADELPEIFRADDPASGVELLVEDRKRLIQLVTGLPLEVFTAGDSLGWCYQFWQAERKDQVNRSGNKIGADDLPSVTQLFTEDYMVDFLLDNTLGAWWAGKKLNHRGTESTEFKTEEEVRQFCALPGCPWKYLRFIKSDSASVPSVSSVVKTRWLPAAGAFDGWPQTAKDLKCLDPCMGSGHFVVAMFERLVALRMAEETLDEAAAVAAVIRDNLFGLEIDPRCTQIAAFNLALAAWRRVGHCKLPAMNLACSGLAPNTRESDWLAIAGDNEMLRNGMERLYRLFKNAPLLGSLINPRASEGSLLEAGFHELQPLLEKILAQENSDDIEREMAVTAHGLAKAAEILAGQFTLVATNVPFLGAKKHDDVLKEYCERVHLEAKTDLATCFVERCLDFCAPSASVTLVTPQSWLFLGTYKKLRQRLLEQVQWRWIVRLGAGAFETIGGQIVSVGLISLTRQLPATCHYFVSIAADDEQTPDAKARAVKSQVLDLFEQSAQLKNPDARVVLEITAHGELLARIADYGKGSTTGDRPRFLRGFWELVKLQSHNKPWLDSPNNNSPWVGREHVTTTSLDDTSLTEQLGCRIHGQIVWNRGGVALNKMQGLHPFLYTGEVFDDNTGIVAPHNPEVVLPLWAFMVSGAYAQEIRKIDQKLNVTAATLVKVPFDLAHWQKVAAEKYPDGLPKPFSSDPTQWLFNGHPVGADQPLHVAVARLLGYRWPRQTGSSFPDCPALGPDGLEDLADDDGIVPISPAKGEGPAAERLRELLARAYGKDWNAARQEELLAQVNYAGASLEDWLRNGFFEQHCALFHHRPFIWHIWDGLKNGFSALVNYHKLTYANLEKLTFAYLGDWIRRQQAAVAAEEAGSDAKLQAAKQLQATLKLILEGEPPYDIFVRWKPLARQAIGWHPDLNDGVRMNIRPFMATDIPGGKKGAGILRARPNIKWDKDRGKEPVRDKKDFPWFWGWDGEKRDFPGVGNQPDGNRWNDCHYTNDVKRKARKG